MLITLVWHGYKFTSGSIFVSWIIFAQKCSLIVNLYEKASGLRRALPCWRWKLGLNKEVFLFFTFCHAFLWFPRSCWFYIPLWIPLFWFIPFFYDVFFYLPDRFYSMWTVWRPFFDFLFFLTKEDGRILFSFDNIFYVGKLLVFNRRMRPDFSYVREDTASFMLQPSVQYGQTRGMMLCL